MKEKIHSNAREQYLRREDDTEFGMDMMSEDIEDTTRYPEFIASFDQWISSEKQKKRANELAGMTDKKAD